MSADPDFFYVRPKHNLCLDSSNVAKNRVCGQDFLMFKVFDTNTRCLICVLKQNTVLC